MTLIRIRVIGAICGLFPLLHSASTRDWDDQGARKITCKAVVRIASVPHDLEVP